MTVIIHNEKRVYPFIYEVNYGSLKTINCYLYHNGQQLILIDAGYLHESYSAYFKQQLHDYGFSMTDIDAIILTHYHEDHTGMVNEILSHKEVPVYAHAKAIERLHFDMTYLTKKLHFFEKLYEQYNCVEAASSRIETLRATIENRSKKLNAPIIALHEGGDVYGLQVFEVPGHSPDSILLLDEEAGWAFSGDLLFKYGTSNALIDFDEKMALLPTVTEQRQSLIRLQQLPIRLVLPGHGQTFTDYVEVAQFYIDRIEKKCKRLVTAISEGNTSVLAIGQALYGIKLEQQFSLVTSEVIGYIDYARRKGIVQIESNGEISLK